MSNRIRHRNHFWQEFEQSQIVVIDPSPYLLFWIGAGWNRDRFGVHMSFKLIRAPEIKRHEMWSMCSIVIFVCDNRKPVECRQSSVYTRPFAVWLSCSVRCRNTCMYWTFTCDDETRLIKNRHHNRGKVIPMFSVQAFIAWHDIVSIWSQFASEHTQEWRNLLMHSMFTYYI